MSVGYACTVEEFPPEDEIPAASDGWANVARLPRVYKGSYVVDIYFCMLDDTIGWRVTSVWQHRTLSHELMLGELGPCQVCTWHLL